MERWRILNTLVLAGQTGRLGLLGSRGGAFYEPYILRELREIRVHRINQLSMIPLSLFLGKTQHVEWDLNKTSKTITGTLVGLFLMA